MSKKGLYAIIEEMVTSQMEKNGDECTDTRFLDFFFSMVPSAKSRLTLFDFFCSTEKVGVLPILELL